MGRIENVLKGRCAEQIRKDLPGFVLIAHQDVRLNGNPDWSLTGQARTTWWEFKHGTPHFDSNGIQELTMLRLAAAGYARYVIFLENEQGEQKQTLIVHPRHLKQLQAEATCVGHNYKFITDFIRKAHNV